MRKETLPLDALVSRGLKVWSVVSLLLLAVNVAIYLRGGRLELLSFFQEGSLSASWVTLSSVTAAWASLGLLLALLHNRSFRLRYALLATCSFLAVILYVNLCRERIIYGDLQDLIDAAANLRSGHHLNARYLYLPFLATALEPLVPLGEAWMRTLLWAGNIAGLAVFVVTLSLALRRYGYCARLAPLAALLFVGVNVPVLRTLFYGQINLHVMNAILLALLLYPRFPFLSAFCLALAIHLKVSPAVLLLPFLIEKNWNWLLWAAVSLFLLAGITLAAHGTQPFLDFLGNASNIYNANGVWFRDNSVDSLIRGAAMMAGASPDAMRLEIVAAKCAILLPLLALAFFSMRRRIFLEAGGRASAVLNGTPALLIFMTLASPLVWEHHGVFLALPFLLVARRVRTPWETVSFGFSYFLEYLMPTFDLFPWSFGRLVGPLILAALIWKTAPYRDENAIFRAAREWLEGAAAPAANVE